jgi:hypothetical protein
MNAQGNKLTCISLDPYPQAGSHDLTRVDEGYLTPSILLNIPGRCDEQDLFKTNPYGRMTEKEFKALAESLKKGWRKTSPITIFVEKGGIPIIHEGNHRLRAAAYAGIKALVDIRYFGNSQKIFLISGG